MGPASNGSRNLATYGCLSTLSSSSDCTASNVRMTNGKKAEGSGTGITSYTIPERRKKWRRYHYFRYHPRKKAEVAPVSLQIPSPKEGRSGAGITTSDTIPERRQKWRRYHYFRYHPRKKAEVAPVSLQIPSPKEGRSGAGITSDTIPELEMLPRWIISVTKHPAV